MRRDCEINFRSFLWGRARTSNVDESFVSFAAVHYAVLKTFLLNQLGRKMFAVELQQWLTDLRRVFIFKQRKISFFEQLEIFFARIFFSLSSFRPSWEFTLERSSLAIRFNLQKYERRGNNASIAMETRWENLLFMSRGIFFSSSRNIDSPVRDQFSPMAPLSLSCSGQHLLN